MAENTLDTNNVFADAEATLLRFAVTRGQHREKTRVLIEVAVVEPHEGNLLAAPGTSHSDHNLYSYEYAQACIEAGDLLDLEPYSLDRRGSKVTGAPKAPKSIDSNDRPILGVLEKAASKAPRSGTAALSPVLSNRPEIPTRSLSASATARRRRRPESDDEDFVEASENAYPLPPHAAAERRTRNSDARTLLVEDSEEGSPPQEWQR
ncbi:hypothetical protein HK405_007179, partial [Cladochytrium tenue]